jgi:hypothetical protein
MQEFEYKCPNLNPLKKTEAWLDYFRELTDLDGEKWEIATLVQKEITKQLKAVFQSKVYRSRMIAQKGAVLYLEYLCNGTIAG